MKSGLLSQGFFEFLKTFPISTLLLEALRNVAGMGEGTQNVTFCIEDDRETELNIDLGAVRTDRPGR